MMRSTEDKIAKEDWLASKMILLVMVFVREKVIVEVHDSMQQFDKKKITSDITENDSCGPYLYFALRYEMKVSREHQCSKGLDCIQDTKWSLVGKCKKPEKKDEDKGKIFKED